MTRFGDKTMAIKFEFLKKKKADTIDTYFDYQTANAGTSPPPTSPFFQGDENHRFLSEK